MEDSFYLRTVSVLTNLSNRTPFITAMTGDVCNVTLYDTGQEEPVIYGGAVGWLNTKLKRKKLAELRQEIAKKRVDRQMLSYLKRLNAIKGVCTQFCCMGHPARYRRTGMNGSGNLIFFVDAYTHRAMLANWREVANWPECKSIVTGHSQGIMRWMLSWKITKHRTYYRKFLNKFIPALRKWRRVEVRAHKEHPNNIHTTFELVSLRTEIN